MSWTLNRSSGTWVCTSYDDVTSGVMNDFAEYGQPVSPYERGFDQNYDPDFAKIVIEMPQTAVMTDGYGKEITAEHFDIVKKFLDEDLSLPFGTYTFDDLIAQGFATKSDRTLGGNLYTGGNNGFVPGSIGGPDAAYVHGTVSVALMKSTTFKYEDGLRQVDAEIGARNDNWDFESATIPDFLNRLVEIILGPSHNNLEGPISLNYTGPGKKSLAERRTPKKNPDATAPGTNPTNPPDGGTTPPGGGTPAPGDDAGTPILPPGGKHGSHPPVSDLPVHAAPRTGKETTTIRLELVSVACWKLNNVRFAFGSSFVVPETRQEFVHLADLRKQFPGAPLSVFGHADPTGDDAFNKQLSGERAESIYAILVHSVSRYESLYNRAHGWGSDCIQSRLTALDYAPDGVREFQSKNGLTADGVAGSKTREKLFLAYFQFLWPTPLSPADFLAKGADKQGKVDFQGCGEFNPYLVFSKAEAERYLQAENRPERDAENEVNRRVMVLFFRPGTFVPPDKWPCPRVTEGTTGCVKRFWSDGNTRRNPQDERREFPITQNTFACRFYHRLAGASPCEGVETQLFDFEFSV